MSRFCGLCDDELGLRRVRVCVGCGVKKITIEIVVTGGSHESGPVDQSQITIIFLYVSYKNVHVHVIKRVKCMNSFYTFARFSLTIVF